MDTARSITQTVLPPLKGSKGYATLRIELITSKVHTSLAMHYSHVYHSLNWYSSLRTITCRFNNSFFPLIIRVLNHLAQSLPEPYWGPLWALHYFGYSTLVHSIVMIWFTENKWWFLVHLFVASNEPIKMKRVRFSLFRFVSVVCIWQINTLDSKVDK